MRLAEQAFHADIWLLYIYIAYTPPINQRSIEKIKKNRGREKEKKTIAIIFLTTKRKTLGVAQITHIFG